MSLKPFVVVLWPSFFPRQCYTSRCSGHRQTSSFPEGASCPPEAALLLVALQLLCCTSDISALVRGVFEIGFAEKVLLGVKDAGRLLRSVVKGAPGRIFYKYQRRRKIPRMGLGGAARCQ